MDSNQTLAELRLVMRSLKLQHAILDKASWEEFEITCACPPTDISKEPEYYLEPNL